MSAKLWNWRLWVGFLLVFAALLGEVFLFATFRPVFWLSVLLVIIGVVLLISGLQRAFGEPQVYRGKILGPILTILSVLVLGAFGFMSYELPKVFPPAKNAPQVGQRAPEFALVDARGKDFSLSQLLSTPITDSSGASRPTKGVLVFFYRGYW